MLLSLVNEYVLLIPVLLGVVIPILTEKMTSSSAPTWIKSSVCAALSLLGGAIATVSIDSLSAGVAGIDDYLIAVLVAWGISGRAYIAGVANKVIGQAPNRGPGSYNDLV